MKIHFNMQISTVSNIFNIKIFACKNVNSHLQRKKAQVKQWSTACFDILVSVDQSVLALWHSSLIPRLCHCNLPFGVFCEQRANVEHLNCFHYNLTYFPHETLCSPVKTSFSRTQALLLPAASPFSPCATPWPRLAGGCKLVFSQFPTLNPKRLCWHLQGRAQGRNPWALQPCDQVWNPR